MKKEIQKALKSKDQFQGRFRSDGRRLLKSLQWYIKMKAKIYQTTREDLEKKFNMRAYGKDGLERRAKEEKLKIRANYGALAILEMKITEIENTSFNQN